MSNQKIKSITPPNITIEGIEYMLLPAHPAPLPEPEKPKSNVLFVVDINELQKGRKYYYVSTGGNVAADYWYGNESDLNRFNFNNVFLTLENAEKQADRKQLLADIQRFAVENNSEIDWENILIDKWFLTYGHGFKYWEVVSRNLFIPNIVYFSSETIATQALKKFKDRLDILLD